MEKSQSNGLNPFSQENVQKIVVRTIVKKQNISKNTRKKKLENNIKHKKSLRTFSILEHIDEHATTSSEQPYLLSMQNYVDGHEDDDHQSNRVDGQMNENDEMIATSNAIKKNKSNTSQCKYKIYLPEGRSIKIGNDRHLLEKHSIDIQISGGLDVIYPEHCKFTFNVEDGGVKKIVLSKENDNATLLVNGVAMISRTDGMAENVEIKRYDIISLGRFHSFMLCADGDF